MRIAILNHGFPPDVGGGETQAYITAVMLQKHGHDVHVFTGKGDRQLSFPFAVTYLKHFKTFEKGESGPKYFVKELKDALSEAGDFDVLYCSNFSSLLAVSYMRNLIKAKVVFTFHCVPAREQNKVIGYFSDWELEKSFARNVIAAAQPSMTICPSGFFYNWAKEFHIPEEKLSVIYNSVILEDFALNVSPQEKQMWRKENNIPPDAFVFLTPARMLPKKGIYELVQAAAQAPGSAYFYIVSSRRNANREFLDTIEQFARDHNLTDKIKIHYDKYSIGEMPRLYQMCDALLLPSHHEGLPVTLLEAMASKKLITCSDIPALQEIIHDGVNGLICKTKNVASLLEMINKAITLDPLERQKLIDNGYQTVVKKSSADKNTKELELLFSQL